jgi:hypothetical protein
LAAAGVHAGSTAPAGAAITGASAGRGAPQPESAATSTQAKDTAAQRLNIPAPNEISSIAHQKRDSRRRKAKVKAYRAKSIPSAQHFQSCREQQTQNLRSRNTRHLATDRAHRNVLRVNDRHR